MNFLMAGTYLDNVAIDRSLSITGAGAKKTTVDGGKAGTVFTINNPAVVTLSGMTITNGFSRGGFLGGGILLADQKTHKLGAIDLNF